MAAVVGMGDGGMQAEGSQNSDGDEWLKGVARQKFEKNQL